MIKDNEFGSEELREIRQDGNGGRKKVLLVANVAKEHVLKFHVPTLKKLSESGWIVDVACAGEDSVPYCNRQFKMAWKRSPFNFSLFKGVSQLKKIVNENDYDIVYCHTPVGALAARLASKKARKTGTKVVYMAHGLHFYKGAPLINWLIYYPIEKYMSRFTDDMILINQEDYDFVERKFKHKGKTYRVDGIGTNLSKFYVPNRDEIRRQYRKELNIDDDATVLVYLAEIIPNKNQTMLVRVLNKLLKERDDIYLVLAGVDYTNGRLMHYAKELGVVDHVRCLGWRNDVQNILAMSDICTASSIREGYGINIVEAMASEVPVIATNNRGHRSTISNNKNGFLVDLKDEDGYAAKILEIMDNKELAESFVVSAKASIDKYSTETIVKKIKEILDNV